MSTKEELQREQNQKKLQEFSSSLDAGQVALAKQQLFDLLGEKLNKKNIFGCTEITSEYKNSEAYLTVVFEELERYINQYVNSTKETTKNKITFLKDFLKKLFSNLQDGHIKNISGIRMALENNNLMNYRRARTGFFEPVCTQFEKNIRFGYFKQLVEIAVEEKIAPMQWLFINQMELTFRSKDDGITAFAGKEIKKILMDLEHVTRRLEAREIKKYEELKSQIDKFTPQQKKRSDNIENAKSDAMLWLLEKFPF